jgi:siderophore synthetase component
MAATQLQIPDEAIQRLCVDIGHYEDDAIAHIREIAAPVVAAELRRLADAIAASATEEEVAAFALVQRNLHARADELDGGTGR